MKLITSKNLSSFVSILVHAIVFLSLILYFNQKIDRNVEQTYVELGFGGTTETNSPGTPGGGDEEIQTPLKKEPAKVKEKEKPKPKEESINENKKTSKKEEKNTASSDSTKTSGKLIAGNSSSTGSGSGTGTGSGNGQPGSGPPKKGLYIPNDIYFVAVDQMPVPVGGMEAIDARVFYPPAAKANNVQGTVYILAFIDEFGNVKKVSLIKGIGYGCDQAAERAVKETRFEPGKLHGIPVKVQLTVPVDFSPSNSD